MRFGVCAGRDKAALLAAAGYDYIELGAAAELVPGENEETWSAKRSLLDQMPLRPEAFNLFVPGSLRIVGPDVDSARLERYVQTTLSRAAQVGGKVIVFGSGGARRIPDGFAREPAERQIVAFLGYCAEASDRTGVTVVVEPLNKGESNIINSVAEGADFVRRVGRGGVRNLADTYHMEKDDELLSAITENADVLAHVHTADTGRFAPATGAYDHVAFFAALQAAGYDSRVSIECTWRDFDAEIGPALAHLRRAAGEAAAAST